MPRCLTAQMSMHRIQPHPSALARRAGWEPWHHQLWNRSSISQYYQASYMWQTICIELWPPQLPNGTFKMATLREQEALLLGLAATTIQASISWCWQDQEALSLTQGDPPPRILPFFQSRLRDVCPRTRVRFSNLSVQFTDHRDARGLTFR